MASRTTHPEAYARPRNEADVAELVATVFAVACEDDERLHYPVTQKEAEALCQRLLTDAQHALCRLALHYHVDLVPLLEILIRQRMAWRFENDAKPFTEGINLEDAERMAGDLDRAADTLSLLSGMLTQDWRASLAKVFEAIGERPEREIEEKDFLRLLCRAEARRRIEDDWPIKYRVDVAVSETFEQYDALRLLLAGKEDPRALDVPQRIDDAVSLLRKAAMTCRRRDWGSTTDSRGQRLFRRGRRRQFVYEAECAREVAEFIRAETSRGLLDYVGRLLTATFPETCGAQWRHHLSGRMLGDDSRRLRQDVQQLLKSAAAEQIADEA